MRIASSLIIVSMLLAGSAWAQGEKKGPPFSEKKKAPEPKPKMRSDGTVVEGTKGSKFEVGVQVQPGVPDANQLAELMLQINEIPKTPHPRFGKSVPLKDGRVVVVLLNPIGEEVGRYLAHQIPLSRGRYGLHITANQDGMFGLNVKGKTADGKTFDATFKYPIAVWPLPEELRKAGKSTAGRRRRPITGK